jgi:uncharacterized protein (DUF2141 family)
VVGLRSADGVVKCALFKSAEGSPMDSSKAIKTTRGRIPAECDFDQVSAGDYGMSVYHSENSNGKFDRNFVGIPKEGVGVSNGADGTFARPRSTAAALAIRVELKPSPYTSPLSLIWMLNEAPIVCRVPAFAAPRGNQGWP